MPALSPRIATTPHSGIRRMAEIAATVEDPLMLVGGDPNFTTPAHIIDGAAAAAHRGATGYAPGAGIQPLREAIAEKVRRRNGLEADAEQVVVTTGGCGGLFTSLLLMLDPGDELLVPDPGWSNYPAMAHVLHARAVGYPLEPADGFSLDPDRLASLRHAAHPGHPRQHARQPDGRGRDGRPPARAAGHRRAARPLGHLGRVLRRARLRGPSRRRPPRWAARSGW